MRWIIIAIVIWVLAVGMVAVSEKRSEKKIQALKNSKFNLLSEINSMQDQIDRAIEKSDKQLAESNRIIEDLKRINTRYELKMRDLKSEIVQLKQEKQRILKTKYN